MNPDYLPALQASLRALGEIAARHDVTDATLAEIAAEIDHARALVASARSQRRANRCTRHPGGPVDPTADNGCLLCGASSRRPVTPPPDGATTGDVLQVLREHGHDAATAQFGGMAVARAVASDWHPSNFRRATPATPDTTIEGEP